MSLNLLTSTIRLQYTHNYLPKSSSYAATSLNLWVNFAQFVISNHVFSNHFLNMRPNSRGIWNEAAVCGNSRASLTGRIMHLASICALFALGKYHFRIFKAVFAMLILTKLISNFTYRLDLPLRIANSKELFAKIPDVFFSYKNGAPLYFSAPFDAPEDSAFLNQIFQAVSIDEKVGQFSILFGALNADKAVLRAVLKHNPNVRHQIQLSQGRIAVAFDYKGFQYERRLENTVEQYFYSMLQIAAVIANSDAVEILMQRAKTSGAPFTAEEIEQALALMKSLELEAKILELSKDNPTPENLVHSKNLEAMQQPLNHSCKRGFEPAPQRTQMLLVKELIQLNADLGLFYYVQLNANQRLQIDIDSSALVDRLDLNAKDQNGNTALMIVAQNYPDLVPTILAKKPDIRAAVNSDDGDTNFTALDLAARVGAACSVSTLLEHANNISQPYTEEEKQQALQAIDPLANIDKPINFQPNYDEVQRLLGGVSQPNFDQ